MYFPPENPNQLKPKPLYVFTNYFTFRFHMNLYPGNTSISSTLESCSKYDQTNLKPGANVPKGRAPTKKMVDLDLSNQLLPTKVPTSNVENWRQVPFKKNPNPTKPYLPAQVNLVNSKIESNSINFQTH